MNDTSSPRLYMSARPLSGNECSLIVRRAGYDGLSVYGGEKEAKKKVEEILLQTWESAEDWFY